MKMHAVRLQEGQDLRQAVIDFVNSQDVASAAIVTVVGSLSFVRMRMAGAQPDNQDVREYDGSYEIVSLVGTIARDGLAHLHISISDPEGRVIGGHLKNGCIVHTTVELVIVSEETLEFRRELDMATGFDELTIGALHGY